MILKQLLEDLKELMKIHSKDRIIVTVNGNPIFRTSYNNNTETLNFEEGSDL